MLVGRRRCMSARNISLTDRLARFIDGQVASGRHQNASEVVREALRRYEDDIEAERASVAAIRAAAEEGIAAIARGDFVTVDGEEGSRALLERLNREAAEAARRGG
jgi:antitoxin ParD1/3/4